MLLKAFTTNAKHRSGKKGKAQIDQYDLVLTAMQIVRATNPKTWFALFQHVNLHPRTRVVFPVFCKKIAGFLRAGKSFKEENVTPTAKDKFALLPTFWHSMTPADRKVVMTVVQSHG